MSGLQGKVVLVTGAKGGLGTFVTNAFLEAGATVAGVSRSIQDSDFDHARFAAFPAELSSAESARPVVAAVTERFGKLDVLVHTVGGFAGGSALADTDEATLNQMLDVNLRSMFHMTRAVLPVMREHGTGRIIGIGSRAAVEPGAGAAAYSVSKAALVALIRAIAIENRDRGINANVVLPGTLDTPANRKAMPDADYKRWVPPAQVARVIVSLASDDYSAVSGAAVPIYGGDL
jgi:NAD(P)-dependent dehydrogenase (short-subunit alcohol dehydrogenase family)